MSGNAGTRQLELPDGDTPSGPTVDPHAPRPRTVALAASVGATIEWYDFFLYGTAAGLVFNHQFFNGLSGSAATLASFATFAVGFVARPIGGLLFGHFGDRVGRKAMLLWTVLIMGGGTAAIGLLPTYDQIGVWAPALLVALRVLQGIGVGGEYGGAVLLATEFAPPGRRGFFGSFAHVGVPGGLFLASGAFALASRLPDAAFDAWGWRACFLVSIVLVAIATWIRARVAETPTFRQVQAQRDVVARPVVELLHSQPRTLLLGMGTRFVEGFTYNYFSVYLLTFVVSRSGVAKSTALNWVMVGGLLGAVLVPVAGALSDRWGRRPVYAVGATIALLLALPAVALAQSGSTAAVAVLFVGGLGTYGLIYGPLAAFWSELFDARYRYSALSFLYQMSGIVAAGLTPLVCAWLVDVAGGSLSLVAVYNVAVVGVSLACLRLLPETRMRETPGTVPETVEPVAA